MQAKNEWELTFNAIPDLIMILGDQYQIVRVNKAMADRLGVSPDEAVGLICYEHVHGTKEPPSFCPHAKLLADGQRHMEEIHEERLGGDFLISVSPLHDVEGHLTGSVHVARNITQQKQTEKALKESEERSREVAELLPQPVFEIDMEGFFTYSNRSGFETFGYTQEDLEKGVNALELFHPKERERVKQNIIKRLTGVEFEDHEYIGLRKDGSTFPILIYTSPIIRYEKTVGVRGIVLDITERKKAEENLQRAQQYLENLIQERTKKLEDTNRELKEEIEQRKQVEAALKGSMEYFQLHSNLANTLLKSPPSEFGKVIEDLLRSIVELLGVDLGTLIYWPEEVISFRERYSWNREGIKSYRLPATPEKFSCLYKALKNGEIFSFSNINELSSEAEKEYFLNEGAKSVIIIPMMVEGKVLGGLVFASFLTNKTWPNDLVQQLQLIGQTFAHSLERKHSEEALRESEDRFRSFMDSATEGFSLWDSDLNLIEINEAGMNSFSPNTNKEDIVGKNILELSPGLEETGRYDRYLNVIESGEPLFLSDVIPHPKFGDLYLSIKAFKVGNGLGMIIEDVTDRKLAEEALRESKQFLSAVFDSIQDGISVLDSELNIIRVNPAMREWYAHMLPLEGRKCYEAYHGRTEACEICPTRRALGSGRLEMNEVPLIQAEGVTGTLELFAFPMRDDSGNPTGVVEYVRDITKRKRAEKALKEGAEKIKHFAYSVSHDLKNPTIGINLLTKQLYKKYGDILDEKGKNYCDQILKASEQLATLVDQINVYISTKESPLTVERVNLGQLFETVRDDFSIQINSHQISWLQPENVPEINVDRLSILRAIRNFVDNALKYGGDELSEIEIGYEESDEFHILSIKDDGIGIAEKDSKKIFSPFERSVTAIGIEGTGLGLAIANEIANRHKGKVWAEFGLEKGVIFYISISKDLRLTK